MTNKRWTVLILIAVAAGLIGWDIYVAIHPVPGDTISEITLAFARRHPVLPFAIGVICGHCFWGQRVKGE